ncbi:MAG: chromate transporter [Holophaga sp.]
MGKTYGLSLKNCKRASDRTPSSGVLRKIGVFFVPRIRKSPSLSAFMDGVNVAAVAVMATVLLNLGRAALSGPVPVVLAVVSAFLLIRYRVNATWLVLGGGAAGLLAQILQR